MTLNEVYRERAHLVAHITALYPSRLVRHDGDQWAIVYVETPSGQLTWHIAEADLDLFGHVPPAAPGSMTWDGHSTPEKYKRLDMLTMLVSHATWD